MNNIKRTKIVCTMGPASFDSRILEEMIHSGMNVARINMSHGSHEQHKETLDRVRRVSEKLQIPIAVVADTKGPAIRTGDLKNEKVMLRAGQKIILTEEPIQGDETRVTVVYEGLSDHIKPGMKILLANGEIALEVERVRGREIICDVKNSGVLGERKRVSIPESDVPGVAETDEEDIRFVARAGVDYIAASFVHSGTDIDRVRELLKEVDRREVEVIAKIETRDAVKNIDDIIQAADGVMVARGDLGVELALEEVPLVQKEIVRKCNRAGKPVIVATQMLKTMTDNPSPTRAEVADVANAILDGTDGIMLSEETAVGKYPVGAVRMMTSIAQRIERSPQIYHRFLEERAGVTEAIGESACQIADAIGAAAIIPSTTSGSTARLVSKFRPQTPIIAVTYSDRAVNKLAMIWGVVPLKIEFSKDTDLMLQRSIEAAVRSFNIPKNSNVVITAGVPFGVSGTTNLIKVERV
jgi:pyruvate kinase